MNTIDNSTDMERQPMVTSSLVDLKNAVMELSDIAHKLIERTERIVRPRVNNAKELPVGIELVKLPVPLAAEIHEIKDGLLNTLALLVDLSERIEI